MQLETPLAAAKKVVVPGVCLARSVVVPMPPSICIFMQLYIDKCIAQGERIVCATCCFTTCHMGSHPLSLED